MANTKISALSASTTPLAGTEVLPIVQSGATVKVSVANLTAGRAISATQLTLSTGNLIVANGQGVDFSATPGTGTSELFADYEEGTWTPNQGSGLTVVGTYSSTGTYTKIGRLVNVIGTIESTTTVTVGPGGIMTNNLPFNATNIGTGNSVRNDLAEAATNVAAGAIIYSAGTIGLTTRIYFSATYSV
jgi:hypothetical protein